MKKNKITFEEFSARVLKNYNGRISVVRESFNGLSTGKRVKAHCIIHNIDFEPEARSLWKGESNCPLCSKEKIHKSHLLPWNKVLEKFHKAYENRFSYDENTYDSMKSDMVVHCNVCGETFKISPVHHLKYNNGGCPNCHTHRIVKCSCCGKEIEADRHVNGKIIIYCEECRKENKLKCNLRFKLKSFNLNLNQTQIEKEINLILDQRKYCKFCGRELVNGSCQNDFCRKIHKSKIIETLIKYFHFDSTKLGTIDIEKEFERIRTILYDMYWTLHMSSSLICEIFNYPSITHLLDTVFKHLNIPHKTNSQSSLENIMMNRLNIPSPNLYKNTYHTTWNNKKVYLRSSYEFDYANILDEKQVDYEVENLRIRYYDTQKLKERIAVPDFYLPDTNTIVEIKSTYTLDVLEMKDKRNAYIAAGYNFELILEHKKCNLDELELPKNNKQYKELKEKYNQQRKTKLHSDGKYRWMHNNVERIKVALDEVEHYQQMGWILGALTPQLQKENIANGVQPCAKLLDISEDN